MMSYYNRQANTMYNVQIECQRTIYIAKHWSGNSNSWYSPTH
ncbi:hypothetical protein T06_12215 [Trichinella sp. T6]|nr:hypothetical protein T06_12215 [Trichinella sp. T6]